MVSSFPDMAPSYGQYNGMYWELNGLLSLEFGKNSFKDPVVQHRNFYGVLGRRVSCHIGQKLIAGKKAQELFPDAVKLIGQIIEAKLLQNFHKVYVMSDSVSYFNFVFDFCTDYDSAKPLDEKKLAVPRGVKPSAITYGLSNVVSLKVARQLLTSAFQCQVVTINDSCSGTELVALGNDTVKERLLKTLKEADTYENDWHGISHKLLDKSANLQWVQGAGCKILEGKEIARWIYNRAKTEESRATLLNEVLDRLNKYQLKIENIVHLGLKIQFVQELSERVAVIRISLNSNYLNAIRKEICPMIADKEFGDVDLAAVRCSPLNPVTYDSPDFMEYMNFFQLKLNEPALDKVMSNIRV